MTTFILGWRLYWLFTSRLIDQINQLINQYSIWSIMIVVKAEVKGIVDVCNVTIIHYMYLFYVVNIFVKQYN